MQIFVIRLSVCVKDSFKKKLLCVDYDLELIGETVGKESKCLED